MFVTRVVVSGSRRESWTVVGDDAVVVAPVERFLSFLTDAGRSPNTVKAYAHDLRDWFEYLAGRGIDWAAVDVEDVAGFVSWLRLPPETRGKSVAVLPVGEYCSAATINRKLAAVGSMYRHASRCGLPVHASLSMWRPSGRRGGPRSFLHHVSKSKPTQAPVVQVRAGRRTPRTLTGDEVTALLAGCTRGRDRLLLSVLADTGMRVGEALGLRHEDWDAAECQVRVVPRDNDNKARTKSPVPRTIPVSSGLVRLYADYLNSEYGDLDSDYVFVNLWGGRIGAPLAYPAVYDLVRRLRKRTGIDFDPHWLRHTYATGLLRAQVPVEVVSVLLGHSSVTTTSTTYAHLTVADTRAALVRAGLLEQDAS
ncbi:site-specific integrase [Leekyejoonella antrihumi]|uniref:Integrase n=1 Tax=Leekyejoonella antrihumi TaxID=1660198 RepID=A0A563DQ51_9MICO|nr:site-specific integrase [Leekyejoonella antrihumi]TWP32357.1 integrase [Leekyejoonella antrihumi]